MPTAAVVRQDPTGAAVVAALSMVLLAGCQTTSRVSESSDGAQGDGASGEPAVGDDGRIVAFTSAATDLVAGDTNSVTDVFLGDRGEGSTASPG